MFKHWGSIFQGIYRLPPGGHGFVLVPISKAWVMSVSYSQASHKHWKIKSKQIRTAQAFVEPPIYNPISTTKLVHVACFTINRMVDKCKLLPMIKWHAGWYDRWGPVILRRIIFQIIYQGNIHLCEYRCLRLLFPDRFFSLTILIFIVLVVNKVSMNSFNEQDADATSMCQ